MNIKLFASLVSICCAASASATSFNDYQFKGAELFSSQSKMLINTEVPLGPLVYANEETNERTEGYYPQQAVQIDGKAKLRVFDFGSRYSAYQVAEMLEKQLNKSGFVTRYRCQDIACGELAGWRAMLSRHIEGNDNLQHVVVASKMNNNLSASYVVGHVTDIDSQPRLVIEVIDAAAPIKSAPEKALTLNFKVNSAELSEKQKSHVADIAEVIQRDKTGKYKITGFADSQGDEASNLALSEARAQSLAKLLIDQHGVPAELVEIKGLGESSPVKSNQSFGGRAANRRVELVPVRL